MALLAVVNITRKLTNWSFNSKLEFLGVAHDTEDHSKLAKSITTLCDDGDDDDDDAELQHNTTEMLSFEMQS
jgi:hypothetical protein